MAKNFLSKYEVIANLAQDVSIENNDLIDPFINTLEKNFDTFFDNLETIAEKYAEIKNLPNNEMWDSRPKIEQIASAYKGIEKLYLEDLVGSLKKYYESFEDDVQREVYKKHRTPGLNEFSENLAKRYVLSFETSEKYRGPKVYSMILGDGSGKSKEGSEFDRNLNLF